MASIREVANRAGVSVATVSRALNNDPSINAKTREMVLSVANATGYVSKWGKRATTNVGFANVGSPSTAYDSLLLQGVYDSSVVAGLIRGLDEARLNLLFLNISRDKTREETYTQFFMRMGVRGVVLRTSAQSRLICEKIAEEGFPCVVLSERFDHGDISYVDCDSGADTKRAVQYLISLGHRRIAFAMHVVPDCDHLDRFEGYKAALSEAGITYDESIAFRHPSSLSGGGTVMEMAVRMADRPTALFCTDMNLAVGAINKAHQLGVHIPDDISVVGFDDAEFRYSVHPRMTAVCQNASQIGFEAASRLARVLSGHAKGGFHVTLPCFFEVNDSTGPPPEEDNREIVITANGREQSSQ